MSQDDKAYSKAEVAGMVQASLALCATCSHARGEHDGDSACLAQWESGGGELPKVTHRCRCTEYWPIREQREDGQTVRAWAVSFGGGLELALDRRVTSELWESLHASGRVTLELDLAVAGKGFKPHKDWGLTETRKLTVLGVHWADEAGFDAETGEVFE